MSARADRAPRPRPRPHALAATLLAALSALATLAPATLRGQAPTATLPADVATPLDGEALRVATAVPDERTPDPGEHYPVSNEWRHDLWFPHVRDLGGAFVGVGSDQCYTLAAIQDARMMWLVDFDPLVPAVHRVYSVLVPASETPDALVARFAPEHAAETRALLEERLAGDPLRDDAVRVFDRNRERWPRYFARLARLSEQGAPTSWLSDPALYARVRALFVGRRVVARNGDLTGDRTVRAIGDAARALGVPVRVVYTSNAEQFFPYRASFVANARALPTDERTVLLRTFRGAGATYPRGDRWHYVVHAWPDFLDRIGEGSYRHSRQILADLLGGRRPAIGPDGLSVIDAGTPRGRGRRGSAVASSSP